MTIFGASHDDKELIGLNVWLAKQLEITRNKNNVDEKMFRARKEFARLKRQRRSLTVTLLVTTLLCTAFLIFCYCSYEARKTRGMTFSSRNESLPVSADGVQQLRAVNVLYSNRPHGLRRFTPFIAVTQSPGNLHLVTNYTNPSYLAYRVKDPEILDVVVILDNFFCAPSTCFFLNDAHNATFFGSRVKHFRDLTHQLLKVPLPPGTTFVKAEYCAQLGDKSCSVLLKNREGEPRFAEITQESSREVPVIKVMEQYDFREMDNERTEIKAFSTGDKFYVAWHDGRLALINGFQWKESSVYAVIDDVDRDEVVEMARVGADGAVLIVLVMKPIGEMRTRIRIVAVTNGVVNRRDELVLFNRPAAITVLNRNDSFEICELAEDRLKCYSNIVSPPRLH